MGRDDPITENAIKLEEKTNGKRRYYYQRSGHSYFGFYGGDAGAFGFLTGNGTGFVRFFAESYLQAVVRR
jgi:hypothetical protein